MQIINIKSNGFTYKIEHNGRSYFRYNYSSGVEYVRMLEHVSEYSKYDMNRIFVSDEDLEREFQIELKRIERTKKLERICQ